PIVRYDNKGNIIGDLAESYDASSDAKTWTFKLRSNVQWHDGQPFSSQDVVYTFNAIMNPKINAVGKSNWTDIAGARDMMEGKADKISGIETPDANTLVFKLTAP